MERISSKHGSLRKWMSAVFGLVFLMIGRDLHAQTPRVSLLEGNAELRFEENKGQVADMNGAVRQDVLFTMKDKGIILFFHKDGISYQWQYKEKMMQGPDRIDESTGKPVLEENRLPDKLRGPEPSILHAYRMDMKWVGASENVQIVAEDVFGDYANFYLAQCPDGITGVKSYHRITYKDLYPNTDVVYYTKDGQLKYDVLLHPGSEVSNVKVAYEGSKGFDLQDGKAKFSNPIGDLTEEKPVAWTKNGGMGVEYSINSLGQLGFRLGESTKEEVVIDPGILWSTYYGGTGSENIFVTVDPSDNVFTGGYTSSTAGISSGGHQNTYGGGSDDAFVVKFDANGVRQWATYYGGNGDESSYHISTDKNGNIFTTGITNSNTAISTVGSPQSAIGGNNDAFVIKFNTAGVRQWGTYYGGTADDTGYATSTDGSGNVYMSGLTKSLTGISTLGSHQAVFGGGSNNDAMLVKFDGSGAVQWATYYGGTGEDSGYTMATDASDNVYLSGNTNSTTAIASGVAQSTFGGGNQDAYIAKFNSSGVRQWSAYFGGPGEESGIPIVDFNDNVYLGGSTNSSTGIAPGATGLQNQIGGGYDGFLAKFNSSGTLQWATYFGASADDFCNGILVDAGANNIYLVGATASTSGITSGIVQNTYLGGSYDVIFAKFNISGSLLWSTYLGGPDFDTGSSLAKNSNNDIYITGQTSSQSGIATGGYQQDTYGGGSADGFLMKISVDETAPSITNNLSANEFQASDNSITISVQATDAESIVDNVTISYGPANHSGFTVTDVNMTYTSGPPAAWTYTISDVSSFLEQGLVYEVSANSPGGLSPAAQYTMGVVYISGLNIPYSNPGTGQSSYEIIAVPLDLANKSVNDVFGDELGNYGDIKKWRMFQYTSSTQELNGSAALVPGVGYWLISASFSGNLNTGVGTSVGSYADPFTVSVNQGWNLLGNPYNFKLSISDVKNDGSNTSLGLQQVKVFSRDGFKDATVLDRFRGGFLFSNTAGTLTFPGEKTVTGRVGQSEFVNHNNAIDGPDWQVVLKIRDEKYSNDMNGFGMHPKASNLYDPFDDFSLPRFLEYLEVNYDKKLYGFPFSKDIVPPADQYEWAFDIETTQHGFVDISWDNSYFGQNSKQLILWDVAQQLAVDMRTHSGYRVDPAAGKSFKVFYGDEDYVKKMAVPDRLVFHSVFPNPSAGRFTLAFSTPERPDSKSVTVEIIDLMGRNNTSFIAENLEAGYHELKWDGLDSSLIGGMYIIRLRTSVAEISKKIILTK